MAMTEPLKGPLCQSCGMPLTSPEDFGSNVDGTENGEYCRYCFHAGAFTDPTITAHAMIEKCVRMMAHQGVMPEGSARILMNGVIPNLKRWRP
jgi:Putative zinc ribbon domain